MTNLKSSKQNTQIIFIFLEDKNQFFLKNTHKGVSRQLLRYFSTEDRGVCLKNSEKKCEDRILYPAFFFKLNKGKATPKHSHTSRNSDTCKLFSQIVRAHQAKQQTNHTIKFKELKVNVTPWLVTREALAEMGCCAELL